MKLNKLARSLALIGIGVHAAGMAWAQSGADVQKVERVEITGSSIKRIAAEGALPLQVITRSEMEKSGIVTAEQLIANLNINGNGMDNMASNADVVTGNDRGNNGASGANLRGQGSSSTLVLLNGRRVAAHGLNGGSVDLNSIPFAAVERVEVLKDGASAIYGTDAVGGVINFILKRNFTGLQASTFYDATEQGGGNIARHSIVGGFGDLDSNGFNLLATFSRSENKALRGNQRDFVNTFQPNRGLSVDTRGTPFATVFPISGLDTLLNGKGTGTGPIQPGTSQQMNGGINVLDLPGNAGCNAFAGGGAYDDVLWQQPAAKWACAWDTGRAAVIQQPVTNTNLVLRGTARAGEHLLTAEYVRGRSESAKSFSPVQISTSGSTTSATYNVTYPSTGAGYDYVFNEIAKVFPTVAVPNPADTSKTITVPIQSRYGQPLAFRWRCMDCGNRELATTSDTGRFLVAAEGPLANGWDYKAGFSSAYSDSFSVAGNGYQYQTDLMNLIKTGVLNPFVKPGESQSAAAMSALDSISARGVRLYGGKYTLQQADASASGALFKLPAGEVMGAVGLDLRKETYEFAGDGREVKRSIYLLPFDDVNALAEVSRKIKAVYGEVLVPITKQLELTAAVRRDDYTGFGSTTNPKFSLRYAPTKSLMFRGSYNTGFRVPTFGQMFKGITESPFSGKDLVDPAKCASLKVDPTVPGCEAVNPNVLTGGKQDLGPEKSKQYSLGLVWQPNDNFSFNVDVWNINREGTIQSLTISQLVSNYDLFKDRFLRNGTGTLEFIDQRWINAGETVTRGLEVGSRFSTPMASGRLDTGFDLSYLLAKKSRLIVNQPFSASEVGRFTRSGDLGLRWKHTAFVTYGQGPWSATITQVYRSGYKDYVLPGVLSGKITPSDWSADVKPYVLHHATVSYRGIKNLSITAGIKNLFNEDPPFSAAYDSDSGAGSSWEPRVADPRGRSYTISATYTFF